MSITTDTTRAIRMSLVLWVLTAIIYPLIAIAIGFIFPFQASGSIVQNQGKNVGSALIGQAFASTQYFQSRPSTTNYSQGDDAKPTGVSGASNLAPSNRDLLKRIQADIGKLKQTVIEQPTADLVYTSGSSLDPHISITAANVQIDRVAKARSRSPEQIKQLVAKNTDGRFLGIFGEPGVNLLKLNMALDILNPKS